MKPPSAESSATIGENCVTKKWSWASANAAAILIHIESNIAKHLGEQIRQQVSPDAKQVITDELPAYIPAFISAGIKGDKHRPIRHRDKVYVQGDIHTNTVESAFSLFNAGLQGTSTSFDKAPATLPE